MAFDRKKWMREWTAARRQAWIDENGPCQKCGSRENLEIDHIDPRTKERNVAHLWTYRQEIRDKELSKCQVLCRTCHFEKTRSERPQDFWGGKPTPARNKHLSDDEVISVRSLLNAGTTHREIASRLGIKRQAVKDISCGRTYATVS
jgi:hypothetical protein